MSNAASLIRSHLRRTGLPQQSDEGIEDPADSQVTFSSIIENKIKKYQLFFCIFEITAFLPFEPIFHSNEVLLLYIIFYRVYHPSPPISALPRRFFAIGLGRCFGARSQHTALRSSIAARASSSLGFVSKP
jgi:hypothetical protein